MVKSGVAPLCERLPELKVDICHFTRLHCNPHVRGKAGAVVPLRDGETEPWTGESPLQLRATCAPGGEHNHQCMGVSVKCMTSLCLVRQSPPSPPRKMPDGPRHPGRLSLELTEMPGRVALKGTTAWA